MKRLVLLGLLATVVAVAGCQKSEGPETTDVDLTDPTTVGAGDPMGPAFEPLTPATDVPPPPPDQGPATSIGDVFTPPPPPDPDLEPFPSQAPRIHVVQPGERLWKIAGHYYGRATRANVDKIVAANPEITDPNRIDPGQKIVIPD